MAELESKPAVMDNDNKCSGCNNNFNEKDRQPRLLNCLHTFCSVCLEQKLTQGGGRITCPKCRQVHQITGSISSLSLDPVKVRLLEYHQVKHQQKIICTECDDQQIAESRCKECKVFLCKDCTFVHKRHRATKLHDVITIDQMSSQPLTSYGHGHFCKAHPAFMLELYCITCSTPCCLSCTRAQEHVVHNTQEIGQAAAKSQTDVDSNMKEVQKFVHALRTSKTEWEKQELALEKAQSGSITEIKSLFERMEQTFDKRKVQILKDYNDRSSKLLTAARTNVSRCEQMLDRLDTVTAFYAQVKDKADDVERLDIFPVVKSKFLALQTEAQQQKTDVDKTTIGFVPVNDDKVNNLIQALGKVGDSGTLSAAGSNGGGARGLIDFGEVITPRKGSAMAEVSPRPRSAVQLQPGQPLTIGQITVHFTTADITKSNCEVIVSSATKNLTNDCGVALPIAKAGGPSLDRECRDSLRDSGSVGVTAVVTTTAGNMPSKHVLHAGRPTWSDYKEKTSFLKDLYKTILRCLCETCNLKAKSVAFPAIATGMSGVPQEECAKIYVRAVRTFLDCTTGITLKEVHFVDVNDKKTKMIREVFVKLQNTTFDANGEEASLLQQFLKQGISSAAKKNLRRSTEKLKS